MRKLLILVCSLMFSAETKAERFVGIEVIPGSSTVLDEHYFEIGTSVLGSTAVTLLFSASTPAGYPSAEWAQNMRNEMTPEAGISGIGKRWDYSKIRVTHSDDVQFWARVDGGNWQLVIPAVFAWQNEYGTTYVRFSDVGSNGFTVSAAAPAVGHIGLVLMLGFAVIASLVVFRRSGRSSV